MRSIIFAAFVLCAFSIHGQEAQSQNPGKYVLMVTSLDGNWGADYPLMALDEGKIKLLNDTPFDGVGIMACNIHCGKPVLADDIAVAKAEEIKKTLKKDLWIRVNLNRMVARREGHPVKKDSEYFAKIKGMDIDNSAGALDDFFKLWRQGLKIARKTSSPGIIWDPEQYHDYSMQGIENLSRKNNIPADKIVDLLMKIGARLADIAGEEYPEAKIQSFFDMFDFPTYILDGKTYYWTFVYIAEGLLARAKEKNIPLQFILGGEDSTGYVTQNIDQLRNIIEKRNGRRRSEMERFGNKIALGASMTVWDNPDKISGWVKSSAGPYTQYRQMEDFTPNIKMLLDNYDFLWIYVPMGTDYNPFDPQTAGPLNRKLEKIIKEAREAVNLLPLEKSIGKLKIDGKPDDCLNSMKNFELKMHPGGGTPKEKTQAWIFYDNDTLYLAFKCFESDMANIKKELKGRDAKIYRDDCVEIFLDPGATKKTYYHFIINPNGELYDTMVTGKNDTTWNANVNVAANIFKDYWYAEIAIPLANFKWNPDNMRMGINLCRERRPRTPSEELSSLAQLKLTARGFDVPDQFLLAGPLRNTVFNSFVIEKVNPGYFLLTDNTFSLVVKNLLHNKRDINLRLVFTGKAVEPVIFKTQQTINSDSRGLLKVPYKYPGTDYPEYGIEVLDGDVPVYHCINRVEGPLACRIGGIFPYPGENVPVFLEINLPDELMDKAELNYSLLKEGKSILSSRLGKVYPGNQVLSLSLPGDAIGKCVLRLELADETGKTLYILNKDIEIRAPGGL